MIKTTLIENGIGGFKFLLIDNNRGQADYIRNNKIKDEHIWNYAEKHIQQNSNAIDIGANLGHHTLKFASLARDGLVYSFEPQRDVFQQLCANIILNEFDNVYAYNIGLGKENKTAYLALHGKEDFSINKEVHRGLIHTVDFETSHKIEVRTLDSFNLKNISFIKIDAENAVNDILEGAINTKIDNKPIIIFEHFYLKRNIQVALLTQKFFSDINYRIRRLKGRDWRAIPR